MATRNPETRYANYSAKDLIKRGEPLDRLELISVESIIREDDLIDTRRVEVLKKDILRSTRGQVSPVAVRARLEKGKIVYDVIDGFHRAEAIRLINQSSEHPIMVKATVLYGCNDEELYDRRVVAADNVKSIKFARMAKWMTASFKSRKWEHQGITSLVKNGDLTLSQVFSLAMEDGSGKILGLTLAESAELKDWALSKAEIWGRTVGSIMMDMRTIEQAAPDLVLRVRTGVGSKGERGVLTQARLHVIVEAFPGEWELQRKFVEVAIKHNIVAKDLGDLAFSYNVYREARDEKSMKTLLSNPDILLHPKPRQEITASQTIFDAKTATKKEGIPLSLRFTELRNNHSRPVTSNQALASVTKLLLSMVEQRAFSLPLSPDKTTTIFNLVTQTITHRRQETPLTVSEARMLFILLAISKHAQKRITGESLINWFFPPDVQDSKNSWQILFNSLKAKLHEVAPHLAEKINLANKYSLTWIDTKEKTTSEPV